jgi:hypothetical protein
MASIRIQTKSQEPLPGDSLRLAFVNLFFTEFALAGGRRNSVALICPITQINHAATFAAKGHLRIVERNFFFADWTT